MPKKSYINLHDLITPNKKNLIIQLLLYFFANFSVLLEILGKINLKIK